jgi:decaprenyl-phosphate phosphoribosyltransferase
VTRSPAGRAAGRPAPRDVLTACRPRQWVKNLLVFTAPAAAGVLTQPVVLGRTAVTFGAFCLAASAGYLFNDTRDAAADRRHPAKAHRPIASGRVPPRAAYALAAALAVTALAGTAALGSLWLLALLVFYLLLTAAYTLVLRRIAVVDLAVVAGCHVVRAVAGAAAAAVAPSTWYLLVVSLGSLLLVAGRREAELHVAGATGTRPTLTVYTVGYLASVRSITSSAMIVTYCLWALAPGDFPGLTPRSASIVPFILLVLRLNLLIERGRGEQPEHLLFHDRQLQVMLGVLALVLAAAVHGP